MNHCKEVAEVFLKLGVTAFGGPAAHIAMMEDEVVVKRKWMSRAHFLDLVGATNLIPGPNSTEMAIHCGFHRAGWLGLIVSGVCFIGPAVVLTGFLAMIYVEYGHIPRIQPFFIGIRPVVLALILGAIVKLGKKAVKGFELGILGCLVVVCVLLGLSEVMAIFCGGFLGMLWLQLVSKKQGLRLFSLGPMTHVIASGSFLGLSVVPMVAKDAVTVPKVFLFFLKIGSILFGSGYVLVAYLQGALVDQWQWLTQQELLDAIAMGQFTPGPVLSTATFVGYQIQGVQGAIWATLGIFLPSFVFVACLNPLIPLMRKSVWLSSFLDAVNVSAMGVMVAVLIRMSMAVLVDWKMALISVAGVLFVIYARKASSVWLVVLGSVLGFLLDFL